jgi:hypothetical protein
VNSHTHAHARIRIHTRTHTRAHTQTYVLVVSCRASPRGHVSASKHWPSHWWTHSDLHCFCVVFQSEFIDPTLVDEQPARVSKQRHPRNGKWHAKQICFCLYPKAAPNHVVANTSAHRAFERPREGSQECVVCTGSRAQRMFAAQAALKGCPRGSDGEVHGPITDP